jgi:hypothetical protein
LFSGQVTVDLFSAGGQIGSDIMTVNVGGNNATEQRGLRWNPAAGWQYQTGSSTWATFGTVQNYQFAGPAAGIGGTGFTPNGNATLHIFAGNTGATKLYIQLAGSGTQNQNPIEVVSNDQATTLFKVSLDGKAYGRSFRSQLDGSFGLQSDYDPAHTLALGTAGGIGFSSTANWYDPIDLGIDRNSAGIAEINSGTKGSLRDLRCRNTIQMLATSVVPGNIGEMVVEATTNTALTLKLRGSDGTVRSATLTLS